MLVPLKDLEPGTIVQIPQAFVDAGYKEASTVVYTGTDISGNPTFLYKLFPTSWPMIRGPKDYYGHIAKIPAGFEVVEDKAAARAFAGWAKGSAKPGTNYSSGCDPEMFVMDAKGKVIPARRALQAKSAGTQRFFDGIQAEFCPLPGGCLEALATGIRSHLILLLKDFQARSTSAKLSIVNSVQLTQQEMDKLEDEDVVFRCSNSMNVYGDIPGSPEPREYLWRFAGGHIHVGATQNNVPKPAPVLKSMVRAMDGLLGVAGVSLARAWDTPERRKYYGRAGEFRLPQHGLEYRVLSNYWLCSPLIYHLTFEIARWAYRLGESGVFAAVWDGSEQETRECINNCDVALAEKIIKRNSGVYSKLFERWKGYSGKIDLVSKAMNTIMNGVDVVVKDPEDIAGNWKFDETNWGPYGANATGDIPDVKWRAISC